MDLIDRLVIYLFFLIVVALAPLSYADILKGNIKSGERSYIVGNFRFHNARDLQHGKVDHQDTDRPQKLL